MSDTPTPPGTVGSNASVSAYVPSRRHPDTLSYVQVDNDILVPAGATVTILSLSVLFIHETKAQILINLPEFDFTNTNGGEAIFQLTYGSSPPTTMQIGHCHADRSVGWPLVLGGQFQVPAPGDMPITFAVQSLSGPITIHGGAGYGDISMRITA